VILLRNLDQTVIGEDRRVAARRVWPVTCPRSLRNVREPPYRPRWSGLRRALTTPAFIAAVNKKEDGTLETAAVSVGRDGITPPM
jgi:hypothetical protein